MRLRTFQFQKVFRGYHPRTSATGRGATPPGAFPSTAYGRVLERKRPGCWDLRPSRTPFEYGLATGLILMYVRLTLNEIRIGLWKSDSGNPIWTSLER